MAGKSTVSTLPTIIERLNAKYPDARYELDWETPLELLVATILAAQCTDERVNRVTPALFKKYPSAKAYADADLEELSADVKPTGFYRNKAKAIQGACQGLVQNFGGEVPKSMDAMLTLPGVARKTANVVLNNAFRIPTGIIVDTHVARVSQRLGLAKQSKPEKIEQELMQVVPKDEWVQFGPGMVLLGRYTCTAADPKCPQCIFKDLCPRIGVESVAAEETVEKKPKKANDKSPTKAAKPAAAPKSSPPSKGLLTPLSHLLPTGWRDLLADEIAKPYFAELDAFVAAERAEHQVFPPPEDVFNAFRATPFEKVKVLLLGQDPYHDDGQAHGMCFSVKPGVKPPPSLVNMFKELKDDLGCSVPDNGYLLPWAKQGVMLLNAVLTVRAHTPASHKDRGWETFTDAVIRALNARSQPVVFLLWGAYAQKKQQLIDGKKHVILAAAHPSPLSVKKFFGSKPFSKANQALKQLGHAPVNWQLPNGEGGTAEEMGSDSAEDGPVLETPSPAPPLAISSAAPATQTPSPIPDVLNMALAHARSLRHTSQLPASWLTALADQFTKPYFARLEKFISREREEGNVVPAEDAVFRAFTLTPFDRVKVVILGDEPPAVAGRADGLAFSLRTGAKLSLEQNRVFQELHDDLGCWLPRDGNLAPWAKQGVLLLNRVLTVRAGEPEAHVGKGWETFTDAVLRALNYRPRPVVFLLWGDPAQKKQRLIDGKQHVILSAPHPAEKTFLGSRPFSAVNNALELRGQSSIYWQLCAV